MMNKFLALAALTLLPNWAYAQDDVTLDSEAPMTDSAADETETTMEETEPDWEAYSAIPVSADCLSKSFGIGGPIEGESVTFD